MKRVKRIMRQRTSELRTTWEHRGHGVRDVMKENGRMCELLPGRLTVNVEHSTTSWRGMHVCTVGRESLLGY